jgi:hypothetical protein
MPDGQFRALGYDPSVYRSFILLHELGHQLKSITGFGKDVPGTPDYKNNQAGHSKWVVDKCF